ncbi:MAG: DUF2752 domain-containing protein [Salinivirgaceae bacterium]|nr:DUF2752 domain-containing protein [Salinivirgaceae bacterium]
MFKIKNNPYVIINLIFAGIIILIIIYSGIFSATGILHPIKSIQKQEVVSTGLSRAFSEIVRFNFSKAIEYNPFSISIFLFFFIQLFLRLSFSYLLLSTPISKKLLIYSDVLVSVLLFLWAFSKFIINQF